MIFLKSHNLIFIKTTKTAGTSIEIALSTYASAQDIVTPFGHKDMIDECMRRDRGGRHLSTGRSIKNLKKIIGAK